VLPPHDQGGQQGAAGQASDDLGARPADLVAAGQRPDERDDARGDEPDAGEVEALEGTVAFRQQSRAEQNRGEPEREAPARRPPMRA
jgi:hypothetical protein